MQTARRYAERNTIIKKVKRADFDVVKDSMRLTIREEEGRGEGRGGNGGEKD